MQAVYNVFHKELVGFRLALSALLLRTPHLLTELLLLMLMLTPPAWMVALVAVSRASLLVCFAAASRLRC